MTPAKVSVHSGKQESDGGNFLSKLLKKNFEKLLFAPLLPHTLSQRQTRG